MSDSCCVVPGANVSGEDICPSCNQKGKPVASRTVNALVVAERSIAEGYPDGHYCQNPECATLYFFDSGIETVAKDEVNVSVGFKELKGAQLVCYCFEHTKDAIQEDFQVHGQSNIEADIRQKVAAKQCSCEEKNPTGRCCLGDVRAAYKDLEIVA